MFLIKTDQESYANEGRLCDCVKDEVKAGPLLCSDDKSKHLTAETEVDEAASAGYCWSDFLFFPENFFDVEALDPDLMLFVGSVADPYYSGVRALNEALQHDHITRPEAVSGGVNARPPGRDVESANQRGASRRDEIDFEGDGNRTALFLAQFTKALQL
jgi:hypothetical protein